MREATRELLRELELLLCAPTATSVKMAHEKVLAALPAEPTKDLDYLALLTEARAALNSIACMSFDPAGAHLSIAYTALHRLKVLDSQATVEVAHG